MNVLEVRRKAIDFFLQKEWPQQEWLSPVRFESLARERGINLIGTEFERWDQNGIFHPLVKIRSPFTRHSIIEFNEAGSVKKYDPQPLNREPLENEDVVRVYGEWWIELKRRNDDGFREPSKNIFFDAVREYDVLIIPIIGKPIGYEKRQVQAVVGILLAHDTRNQTGLRVECDLKIVL